MRRGVIFCVGLNRVNNAFLCGGQHSFVAVGAVLATGRQAILITPQKQLHPHCVPF